MTDPGPGDAVRRTRLANERTYLAWLRTGIASLATSLAVGRLLPALTDGHDWPYAVIGGGWAIVGMLIIGYGLIRARDVEEAVSKGEFAPLSARAVLTITTIALALGMATFFAVLVQV